MDLFRQDCVDGPVYAGLCGWTCLGRTVWMDLFREDCVDGPV